MVERKRPGMALVWTEELLAPGLGHKMRRRLGAVSWDVPEGETPTRAHAQGPVVLTITRHVDAGWSHKHPRLWGWDLPSAPWQEAAQAAEKAALKRAQETVAALERVTP